MGRRKLLNCKINFRLNPRWRSAPKLDIF